MMKKTMKHPLAGQNAQHLGMAGFQMVTAYFTKLYFFIFVVYCNAVTVE